MPEQLALREFSSPIGALRLAATSKGLVRLAFPRERGLGFRGWLERHVPDASSVDWVPVLDKVAAELEEYFSGRRTAFSVHRRVHKVSIGIYPYFDAVLYRDNFRGYTLD